MTLYIHVGTGKTGTSSLQAWLSNSSWLTHENLVYVSLRPSSDLLQGQPLAEFSEKSPHGYAVSAVRGWLKSSNQSSLDGNIQIIVSTASEKKVVISDESLWQDSDCLNAFLDLFPSNLDIRIIMKNFILQMLLNL